MHNSQTSAAGRRVSFAICAISITNPVFKSGGFYLGVYSTGEGEDANAG